MSSNITTTEERGTVNISEIFYSVQGEGLYTGEPTVFVRFQGCTLGCVWCDTKYTWKHEEENGMSYIEVLNRVWGLHKKSDRKPMICITGGEPLEQPEQFAYLVKKFHALDYSIEVETSGLVPVPFEYDQFVDSWVVDFKGPSAEVKKSPVLSDFTHFRHQDQLKCVVKDQEDLNAVRLVLQDNYFRGTILISPGNPIKGVSSTEWMEKCAEFCKQHGYRLSLQTHKFIWGAKRGV
jgi:7-carboxy-7-deazaguanine synthase